MKLLYTAAGCVLWLAANAVAFAPHAQVRSITWQQQQQQRHAASCLSMSLRPLYDELVDTVTQKYGLVQTDFCERYDAQQWSSSGSSGTAEWLAESSPQYLTGVSTYTRSNQQGPIAQAYTINIWIGPSYEMPHMLLTFGEMNSDSPNKYFVQSDYVPRGAVVLGSDPQYLDKFYGSEVQESYQRAYSSGFPILPAQGFYTRMLASPVATAVAGLDQQTAESLVRNHVDRLINAWHSQAQVVPARSRGSFNMRDDKLRQFFYRGQVELQTRELGQDLGSAVAAVNTGPVAEAYVGGGS